MTRGRPPLDSPKEVRYTVNFSEEASAVIEQMAKRDGDPYPGHWVGQAALNWGRQAANPIDAYVRDLGKILGNLHSLELALRAFLFHESGAPRSNVAVEDLDIGDEVPESPFTDSSSLGQLVAAYNKIMRTRDPAFVVSEDVVPLRDNIIHGRVSGRRPEPPFRLMNYSKPKGGKVTITASEVLTPEWMEKNRRLLHDEIMKVGNASRPHGAQML